jgi:hypothetical protein
MSALAGEDGPNVSRARSDELAESRCLALPGIALAFDALGTE